MALLKLKTNRPSISEALRDFVSLFFPNYCLGCERALVKGEDILCTICLFELPKTDYHYQDDNPLYQKISTRLRINYAWAFLRFRKTGIAQHLMHQLKYNNHPEVGLRLGKVFGMELVKAGFKEEFDYIVPVPLHKSKQRRRGYNQSAKFAAGLSESLKIPVLPDALCKILKTETQTKKGKTERWVNVSHSFQIRQQELVKGNRILLVDDVVTTGATLEACGQELLNAGCSQLSIACIAEAQ